MRRNHYHDTRERTAQVLLGFVLTAFIRFARSFNTSVFHWLCCSHIFHFKVVAEVLLRAVPRREERFFIRASHSWMAIGRVYVFVLRCSLVVMKTSFPHKAKIKIAAGLARNCARSGNRIKRNSRKVGSKLHCDDEQ